MICLKDQMLVQVEMICSNHSRILHLFLAFISIMALRPRKIYSAEFRIKMENCKTVETSRIDFANP